MSKARSMARMASKETFLPVGTISYFPDASIPTGWLSADGSAVSRTTYAALFAKIGTTYGAVSNTAGQQVGGAGGGGAHNNMQPFMSVNMCIYAGA